MSTIVIAAVAMFAALYAIGAMLGLVAAAFARSGRYDEDENAGRGPGENSKEA